MTQPRSALSALPPLVRCPPDRPQSPCGASWAAAELPPGATLPDLAHDLRSSCLLNIVPPGASGSKRARRGRKEFYPGSKRDCINLRPHCTTALVPTLPRRSRPGESAPRIALHFRRCLVSRVTGGLVACPCHARASRGFRAASHRRRQKNGALMRKNSKPPEALEPWDWETGRRCRLLGRRLVGLGDTSTCMEARALGCSPAYSMFRGDSSPRRTHRQFRKGKDADCDIDLAPLSHGRHPYKLPSGHASAASDILVSTSSYLSCQLPASA